MCCNCRAEAGHDQYCSLSRANCCSTMSGRVLVYGGRGALGSEIVTKFKHEGWWVANIDTAPNTQVGCQG